jgi:hypothetical protein
VQHHNVVLAETLIDLYNGQGESAWRRIDGLWSTYRRSLLLQVQQVRIDVRQSRARSALAVAADAEDPEPWLRSAHADAVQLSREKAGWAQALSLLIRAGIAHLRGDETMMSRRLESAVTAFEAADMALHAAACRWHLGDARGGEEGWAMIADAKQQFADQAVVNPMKLRGMLAPGFSPAIEYTRRKG